MQPIADNLTTIIFNTYQSLLAHTPLTAHAKGGELTPECIVQSREEFAGVEESDTFKNEHTSQSKLQPRPGDGDARLGW